MVLKKDKNSGVYHAHFRDQSGKRRSVTTKQKDRQKAKEAAEAAKIESLEKVASVTRLTGEVITRIIEGEKVTMRQAFERWMVIFSASHDSHTVYSSKFRIVKWLDHQKLWDKKPYEITPDDVDRYFNRDSGDVKASSLQCALGTVRMFLSYCVHAGFCTRNPAQHVVVRMEQLTFDQKESRPIPLFTPNEVKRILANTEGFWRAATALGYYCGLRISDICQLEWRSTAKEGRLIIWTDKGDVRFDEPMPSVVGKILAEMPVNHSRFLFPDEREINLSPTRRALLSTNFKNLLNRLGIEGKTFHGLRHTYAMRMKVGGASPERIAEAMAHRDLKSQESYTKH